MSKLVEERSCREEKGSTCPRPISKERIAFPRASSRKERKEKQRFSTMKNMRVQKEGLRNARPSTHLPKGRRDDHQSTQGDDVHPPSCPLWVILLG